MSDFVDLENPGSDTNPLMDAWASMMEQATGPAKEHMDTVLRGIIPKGDDGDPGPSGESAYQTWLDLGNVGSEADFIASLEGTDGTDGEDGTDGLSAYQIWLNNGNVGTEEDYLASLEGPPGTTDYNDLDNKPTLGTAAAQDTTAFAPSSHVGSGGGAHSSAVASGAAGFMSGTDKAKLDGVAAGATVNSSDAYLLARGNHTGDQAQSTITGLVTALANLLPLSGGTLTSFLTLHADPTLALHAVTKQYVDGLLAGLGKRGRVRVATTGNITISTALNNGDVLNGVTLATGDLVLVKDQTTGSQNGVYVVGASPSRDTNFDAWDEFPGSLIGVAEGTQNGDTVWLCTNNAGGTLNTTAIVYTKLNTIGELLAANNLSDLANVGTARTNLGLGTAAVAAIVLSLAGLWDNPNDLVSPQDLWDLVAVPSAATATGTVTVDFKTGLNKHLNATGNVTLGATSNVKEGTSGTIEFVHSGAARTLALNTTYWCTDSGAALELSAVSGARDVLGYTVLDGGKCLIGVIGKAVA